MEKFTGFPIKMFENDIFYLIATFGDYLFENTYFWLYKVITVLKINLISILGYRVKKNVFFFSNEAFKFIVLIVCSLVN